MATTADHGLRPSLDHSAGDTQATPYPAQAPTKQSRTTERTPRVHSDLDLSEVQGHSQRENDLHLHTNPGHPSTPGKAKDMVANGAVLPKVPLSTGVKSHSHDGQVGPDDPHYWQNLSTQNRDQSLVEDSRGQSNHPNLETYSNRPMRDEEGVSIHRSGEVQWHSGQYQPGSGLQAKSPGHHPGASQTLEDAPEQAQKLGGCYSMVVNLSLLSNGLNIGLNVGLLGPTLPDLALLTGSTLTDMTVVFISSSIAYMLGSVACGLMLGRFEGYLLISITLILQAICNLIAPWCTNLALLSTFIALAYFFSTVIIAGTAYLCFRLERTRARVMTQTAFLLFNLGKALVPFIVAPFLSDEDIVMEGTRNVSMATTRRPPRDRFHWFRHVVQSDPEGNGTSLTAGDQDRLASYVGYGYMIVAIFSLFMSALYMLIAVRTGCHLWAPERDRKSADKQGASSSSSSMMSSSSVVCVEKGASRKAVILLVFFIMIFLQCGMESVDAGLMMSFLAEYLDRGKDAGVVATAVYQGTKVLVCVLVVLTIRCLHPASLLLLDFAFMLVSTSLMAVAIHADTDALLWLSFVLLAAGMSNSYATLASWLETRYPITGLVTSILTVSFGFGSMVLPTLTTVLLDTFGPIMFPLVLLVSSVLCVIIYVITKVLMQEPCCPRPDNTGTTETDTAIYGQGRERQPLLQADGATDVTDNGTISEGKASLTSRKKQQSLSELSPDQCFHAYHSRFIDTLSSHPGHMDHQ